MTDLTPADVQALASATVAFWGLCFAIRLILRTFR